MVEEQVPEGEATPEAAASATVEEATPEAAASATVEEATPEAAASATVEEATPEAAASAAVKEATPEAAASATVKEATPEAAASVMVDVYDVEQQWASLSPGPKASALRSLYEEQQKQVAELQRQAMLKTSEIAAAIVRARAAKELQQPEVTKSIVQDEVVPKQKALQDLEERVKKETELLNAYTTIGQGVL